MDCSQLSTVVQAFVDGELVASEAQLVEAHAARCAACTERISQQRQLVTVVRAAKGALPQAPLALRARLQFDLAEEGRRSRRKQAAVVFAGAAAVALIGLTGTWQHRAAQRRAYADDAAQRHARQYPLEVQPKNVGQDFGQNVEQLEAFFAGKLDHRVAVPQIPNARAAGARLLNVREKPAAYIRYDTARARQLGLFVYGDPPRDVAYDDEPQVANSHGYNVVSWRNGDVVYQLVSDLDERDVLELLPPSELPLPSRSPQVQPASFQR